MKQFDPIFFTPPSGDTKRPRRLHKGGGGDGGAAERQAEEKERVRNAISKINQIFGVEKAAPEAVDRNAFMRQVPVARTAQYDALGRPMNQGPSVGFGQNYPQYTTAFDTSGFNQALAAAQAKADALSATAAQREGLYKKIGADATNKATFDLNKDRDVTEREFKFMLARAGLSGGSRDIDVNREVLDTYQQGVLKAADMGTSTANNARSADDKTRVNLINSISAGLDQGSATQQAYEGMRNNARQAQDDANATSMVGFFDVLRQQQQQAAYNQGNAQAIEQYKKTPQSSATSSYGGSTRSY